MDASESLVEKYLNTLGLGAPVFHPDGDITPDFLLAGYIAVEVRRLNQNIDLHDGTTESLEQLDISLWKRLKKLLPTLGASINGESWMVEIDFRRPKEPWKQLESKIREKLEWFMHYSLRRQATLRISTSLDLYLMRSESDHNNFYFLGASYDEDHDENKIAENLKLCITEKEYKAASHRGKYREWWLVLLDHAGFFWQDSEYQKAIRSEVIQTVRHSFNKIIIIDLNDHLHIFEI